MQIFNTLTRQKEEFVPQVPGEYRIYVCGPTVYNYIHIGNARPLIVFDTLRRYLEYRGNKVIYVSKREGTSMKEVAQRFEAEYLKDAAGLNCKKPTVQPRATEHIQQILDIVKDLIDSGHAYVAKNGDVYFRVKSDPEYGKLSHLKLDDLESGNRELRSQMEDDLKEDPADFAVWKAAKPGEPAWESPYGMGRPRLAHRVQRHEPHPSGQDHRPALRRSDAGVNGAAAQLLLDAQQLVVLGHALGAAGGTGLDLAGVQGHGQVGNGGVLGLAGAVRADGGVTGLVAILMASSVSETEPIWFSLIRMALPAPSWMPLARRSVLVTNRSSPTSWTLPPSSRVISCQPSQSSSSRPSSMEMMGYFSTRLFQWAISSLEVYSVPPWAACRSPCPWGSSTRRKQRPWPA